MEFSDIHRAALENTRQYKLGADLISRLGRASTFAERTSIVVEAEETFDQLSVRQHAIRVAQQAKALALFIGFDEGYANRLYSATRLHDVGKLFMPEAILNKNGWLTDDERSITNAHSGHGADILGPDAPEMMLNVARYHHERYDGKGTNKLAGENIPVEARLAQIADVYDAIISPRSYKEGNTVENTLTIMVNNQKKSVEFDPFYLRAFVKMKLAEHSNEISPASRVNFEAFINTHPSHDLKNTADQSVFDGWSVDPKGRRRKYLEDDGISYRKLLELRDHLGNVYHPKNLPRGNELSQSNDGPDIDPNTPTAKF